MQARKLNESPEFKTLDVITKITRGYNTLSEKEDLKSHTMLGLRAVKEKVIPYLEAQPWINLTPGGFQINGQEEEIPSLDNDILDICLDTLALWDENNALPESTYIAEEEIKGKSRIPEALRLSIADKILQVLGPLPETNAPAIEIDNEEPTVVPEEDPDVTDEVAEEEPEADKDEAEIAKNKIRGLFTDEGDNTYLIGQEVKKEVIEPALKAYKEAKSDEERETWIKILKEIIEEIRKAKKDTGRFPSVHDENGLDNIARTALEQIASVAVNAGATDPEARLINSRSQNAFFKASPSTSFGLDELEAVAFEALGQTISTDKANMPNPEASEEERPSTATETPARPETTTVQASEAPVSKPEETKPEIAEPSREEKEAPLSVDFTIGIIGLRRKFHINKDSDAYTAVSRQAESYEPEKLTIQTEFFAKARAAGLFKQVNAIRTELETQGWADGRLVMQLIKATKKHDLALKSKDYEKRIMPLGLVTEVK